MRRNLRQEMQTAFSNSPAGKVGKKQKGEESQLNGEVRQRLSKVGIIVQQAYSKGSVQQRMKIVKLQVKGSIRGIRYSINKKTEASSSSSWFCTAFLGISSFIAYQSLRNVLDKSIKNKLLHQFKQKHKTWSP